MPDADENTRSGGNENGGGGAMGRAVALQNFRKGPIEEMTADEGEERGWTWPQ